MTVISEELHIEEYFYPLAKDYNPVFEFIIKESTAAGTSPKGCFAKMSEWNIHHKHQSINKLIDWILTMTYSHFIQPFEDITNVYPIKCSETWGMSYDEGHYLKPHRHDPTQFSFVYYVNAPEGSSPLVFPSSGHEIKAEAGKVTIFESRLLHSVPPNQ